MGTFLKDFALQRREPRPGRSHPRGQGIQLGTPTEAYDEEGREVRYPRLDMDSKILEETQPGLNSEDYDYILTSSLTEIFK